jgi:hypothetical protein
MRQVDLSSLSRIDVMQRLQVRVSGQGYFELSSLAPGKYDFTLCTEHGTYEFRRFTPKEFGRQIVQENFEGGQRALDLTARKLGSVLGVKA